MLTFIIFINRSKKLVKELIEEGGEGDDKNN